MDIKNKLQKSLGASAGPIDIYKNGEATSQSVGNGNYGSRQNIGANSQMNDKS